jgi:hypothetical protein
MSLSSARSLMFAIFLAAPAFGQDSTTTPSVDLPKAVNINKFVPSGMERAIGFVVSVFPDCSSRGPVVPRVIMQPAHGTVTFATEDSFSNFAANSRFAACNEKKGSGLTINYKSEDSYVGEDHIELLLMFPDGSAATWHFLMLVR